MKARERRDYERMRLGNARAWFVLLFYYRCCATNCICTTALYTQGKGGLGSLLKIKLSGVLEHSLQKLLTQ